MSRSRNTKHENMVKRTEKFMASKFGLWLWSRFIWPSQIEDVVIEENVLNYLIIFLLTWVCSLPRITRYFLLLWFANVLRSVECRVRLIRWSEWSDYTNDNTTIHYCPEMLSKVQQNLDNVPPSHSSVKYWQKYFDEDRFYFVTPPLKLHNWKFSLKQI